MRFTIGFAKQVWAGLLVLLALTVVLGVVYPAAVWGGVSRISSGSAEGSPVTDAAGCVVGSAWVGVDPQVAEGQQDPFFHNRVVGSVSDEDPFATGDPAAALPSNQGPSSEILAGFVIERRAAIAAREGVDPASVPVDAVTGSARVSIPTSVRRTRTAGREGGGQQRHLGRPGAGLGGRAHRRSATRISRSRASQRTGIEPGTRIDGTYVCCTDDWWMIVT